MGGTHHPVDARGLVLPDAGWPAGREAPAPLELVRRFLNTHNRESGGDGLRTPAELAAWSRGEGFPVARRPTRGELELVRELRDVLHALATANRAAGDLQVPDARFDELLAGIPCFVQLTPEPRLVAVRDGVDAFVIALADAVLTARRDGSWRRLKPCGHCRWVIYDRSYNASGSWCSPRACGSRLKARAWRARERERRADQDKK